MAAARAMLEGAGEQVPDLAAGSVLDDLPIALYATDAEGRLIYCNGAAIELWGVSPQLGVARWCGAWRLFSADGVRLLPEASPMAIAIRERRPVRGAESVAERPDGSRVWFLHFPTPVNDGVGTLIGGLNILIDITERRRAEIALMESEQRYRYTIELGGQIPWGADADGRIIDVGGRWPALTGLSPEQTLANGPAAAFHPDDVKPTAVVWYECVRTGEPFDAEYRLRLREGGWRWHRSRAAALRADDGSILRWYGTIEDVHDRKTAEDEVRWTAGHDGLTGLSNRMRFTKRLHETLEAADERGAEAGLLLLDIDHFKHVNDQLGHDAGDELLRVVAERLREAVADPENIGRLGGDEFAVLVPGIRTSADLIAAGERVLNSLNRPFSHAGQLHDCRASIGAAMFPRHGQNADELLKSADIALYDAKAAGRGGVRIFRSGMRAELQRRASMVSLARYAIEQERIVPFYQPKIELASGRIAGFEALLRWEHPRLGLQFPATIASAFEDIELALALSDRMFAQVIADIRGWMDAGIGFGRVAVNASAAEFQHDDFAERLLERLAAAGVPPSSLELEITETVFLGRGSESVERALKRLSAAGVTIALDDFGTGFASLSHLKHFPVDVIKIDRSFVSELSKGGDDAAIVRAVIGLGRSLSIITVAEGIETKAQAERLCSEGCDLGQGYLFGKAREAAHVPLIIRGGSGA
jgi:diguanylate cyclase (GGDEF)-like protein/PAS domain S-box-containing protein